MCCFMLTTSLPLWLRCPPRERMIPDSNLTCAGIFPGSSHTSDLKIGNPGATPPVAWRYRVSAGTGWPGVSILCLGEMESLICNSISVWQYVQLSEQIRPWDTLACYWDVKQPTNKTQTVSCRYTRTPSELDLGYRVIKEFIDIASTHE